MLIKKKKAIVFRKPSPLEEPVGEVERRHFTSTSSCQRANAATAAVDTPCLGSRPAPPLETRSVTAAETPPSQVRAAKLPILPINITCSRLWHNVHTLIIDLLSLSSTSTPPPRWARRC